MWLKSYPSFESATKHRTSAEPMCYSDRIVTKALLPRQTDVHKWLLCGICASVAGAAMGQDSGLISKLDSATGPVRIPIRHADPWMVKMMIEGTAVVQPEYSSVLALGGAAPAPRQNSGKGLLTSGHLMVNPTDNSLWYIPDRKAKN